MNKEDKEYVCYILEGISKMWFTVFIMGFFLFISNVIIYMAFGNAIFLMTLQYIYITSCIGIFYMLTSSFFLLHRFIKINKRGKRRWPQQDLI